MTPRLRAMHWIAVGVLVIAFWMGWVQLSFGWNPPWLSPLILAAMFFNVVVQYMVYRAQRRERAR